MASCADMVPSACSAGEANGRVHLVDGAIGGDAGGMLGDPRAVAERGVAAVTGAGVDFVQDNHAQPPMRRKKTKARITATAIACARMR